MILFPQIIMTADNDYAQQIIFEEGHHPNHQVWGVAQTWERHGKIVTLGIGVLLWFCYKTYTMYTNPQIVDVMVSP